MRSEILLPRRYTRFCTRDNVYARVNKDFSKVGKVKDISLGGMAFEIILDDLLNNANISCEIIVTNDSCCIHNLSCVIVYQTCLASTTVKDNISINLSRCGVSFRNMDGAQQSSLNNLIFNYCFNDSAK